MCYVLEKKLLLNNKLDLLTYQQLCKYHDAYEIYFSILNARDKEYFVAAYDNKFNAIIKPVHFHIEELQKTIETMQGSILVTGEISPDVKELFKIKDTRFFNDNNIDLTSWAMYAYEQYKCNSFVNLWNAEPFYLKSFFTNKSLKTK